MTTLPLSFDLVSSAKWAFTTRRVARPDAACLLDDLSVARSGDLVLGRVEEVGSHKNIQLATGRPAALYPEDYVVLACGDRYAPDQFEGIAQLSRRGADMLAGGGVLGRMRHRNGKIGTPTRIVPLGLIGDRSGVVINTARYAAPKIEASGQIQIIGVVGASMNSGKTTTVASLVHGLTRAGHRVAAIKVTGTGAFGDYNAYQDAGVAFIGDFVDAGMVSTYRQPSERIEAGMDLLLDHARAAGCTIAVIELADGIFQSETAALLEKPAFRRQFAGFLFAAPDALSVMGGAQVLEGMGIRPYGVSGLVSRSPLAAQEAQAATNLPVITRAQLLDPVHAHGLLTEISQGGASGDTAFSDLAA